MKYVERVMDTVIMHILALCIITLVGQDLRTREWDQ
jgi:hypothetical protein